MKIKNTIISIPRSGNHLLRFLVELLSEIPTIPAGVVNKIGIDDKCTEFGKFLNIHNSDKPIFCNKYDESIPFNIEKADLVNSDLTINKNYNYSNCYVKAHHPKDIGKSYLENVILILRNPKELLIREFYNSAPIDNINSIESKKQSIDRLINHYDCMMKFYHSLNKECNKIIFFYEELLEFKEENINILYDFLKLNNIDKKNYTSSNIEKLYNLSLNGKQRSWGGNNSNSDINFYTNNLKNDNIHKEIDLYLKTAFDTPNLILLKEHYNL